MKRALLVMRYNSSNLKEEAEKAERYCKDKVFDFIGSKIIYEKDVLMNPEKVFESLKWTNAEVILSQDNIFLLGEFSPHKSLLSFVEGAGFECFDIDVDVPVRELVEYFKRQLFKDFVEEQKIEIPVLVLYKGRPGFEQEHDFCDVRKYIHDELNIQRFSVVLYPEENDGMLEEFLDVLKKQKPNYIIHNEPFVTEKMRLFVDLIENYGISNMEIIDMDEVHHALSEEQSSDINISLYLH